MTNQQGAPEALRPIARYKIGYHADEWGMRSSTPSGIPDQAGAWVRYEDHVAALVEAQQPAPSAAAAVGQEPNFNLLRKALADRRFRGETDLQDLVNMAANIIAEDGAILRARQTIIEQLKTAAQPSPTPQADSAPVAAPAPNLQWTQDTPPTHGICSYDHCTAQTPLGPFRIEWKSWKEHDARCLYLNGEYIGCAANTDGAKQLAQGYIESIAKELAPYRAARAPADSVTAPAGGVVAAPTWKPLQYATPRDLWNAFKGGTKFVLHYHSKAYPVERMEDRETVVYVQPPGMPVKLYPDGRNCESAGDAIWLEELAATPPAQAADSVLEDAAREAIEKVLALFPFNVPIQMFTIGGGPNLTADGDTEFYSVKRVLAFLTEIKTTLDAARKQGANHD